MEEIRKNILESIHILALKLNENKFESIKEKYKLLDLELKLNELLCEC